MRRFHSFIVLSAFLLVSAYMAWVLETSATEQGLKIFIEKRCYTCHTIKAEAKAVEKHKEAFAKAKGVELSSKDKKEKKRGGDLSDVGKKRSSEWLSSFVKNPKDYFKAERKCQKNAKKKNRKKFKGTDIEYNALITYLSGLKYDSGQEEGFESCLKE